MEDRTNITACIKCGDIKLVKDYRHNDLSHWSWRCMICGWEDRRVHIDKKGLAREFNGNI